MLGLARSRAADPWLWLAGLSICTEREGVPLPRSGGGWEGADAPAAPYKHRLAHDPGSRRFGFPGGRSGASGSWGLPQVAFGHFWRVKSATPAVAVQIITFYKACPADRREESMIKRLRGGWGAGLRFAEEGSRSL